MKKPIIFLLLCVFCLFFPFVNATTVVVNYTANGTFVAPSGIEWAFVEVWGAGGGGGGGGGANKNGGGGAAGGQYAATNLTTITAGSYTVTIGKGGTGTANADGQNGQDSWFNTTSTIIAKGGEKGLWYDNGGTGGTGTTTGGIGTTVYAGGSGVTGIATRSGGGGGGAGSTGTGNNASGATGGALKDQHGGAGGAGTTANSGAGGNANPYGAGGGGATKNGNPGNGADGLVRITYVYTVSNAAPFWNTNLADSPDPIIASKTITYTGTGDDRESDNYYMTVCRTNNINSGAPGTCDTSQTLCTSSSTVDAAQASCTYATQQSDTGTLTAYGFLCDTGSNCNTTSTSVTTTVIQNKSGLVSTTAGAVPFYTNYTNPQNKTHYASCLASMTDGDYCIVTWWVNATGKVGNGGKFWAYANSTVDSSLYNTTRIDITITAPAGANSCVYGGSGNFVIDCTDECTVSSNYDLGGNNWTLEGKGNITLNGNVTGWKYKKQGLGCWLNIPSKYEIAGGP